MIDFDFNVSLEKSEIEKIVQLLKGYQQSLRKLDFFKLVEQDLLQIKNLAVKKQKLNPKVLVVIGIGGSNLGTLAIQEAILGQLYNESAGLKIFYADTVDSDYISKILLLVEEELKSGNEVIINIVSKSGRTLETIANFAVFLELLKKYKPNNFQENIVVISDKDSALWNYAEKNEVDKLEIPKNLGGRFSVFSAVGLFPLSMLNIDIYKLIEGAKRANEDFITQRAAVIYLLYKQSININDLFIFYKNLSGYGLWYRQLMAESLGKELDNEDAKIEISLIPTVSIGSTDLHSVGQLYLAFVSNQFTSFIEVKNFNNRIIIPKNIISELIEGIELKNYSELMNIILQGVKTAYSKKNIPFCSIALERVDELCLAYLMQTNMIEIILVGFLLNINPFDQPNVELYKNEVNVILQGL
jgi:glucose-6-phosphate isomerase